MKSIVYFTIGVIAVFFVNIEGQKHYYDDYCNYTEEHEEAICFKNNKGLDPVIPNHLSKNLMGISLKFSDSLIPWLITQTDYFKRYSNLHSLQIYGSVRFSSKFKAPEKQSQLLEGLFDLPKLKNLQIYNAKFYGITSKWKLPPSLEKFTLFNSTGIFFDLKNCPNLNVLVLVHNNLIEMPELFYPPPLLNTLFLQGNPLLPLTVRDLASFCKLQYLSFDISGGFLSAPEAYCECMRLKKWLREVKLDLPFLDDEWKCSGRNVDCKNYTLEEARTLRETCLNNSYPLRAILPLYDTAESVTFRQFSFWVLLAASSVILLAGTGVFLKVIMKDEHVDEEEEEEVQEEGFY